MTEKIELPVGLKTQRPAVSKGDQVLVLAFPEANLNWRREEKRAAVGTVREASSTAIWSARLGGDVIDVEPGWYVSSWAVVNGPVEPGDKVIALEFEWDDDVAKVRGIVAKVCPPSRTMAGRIWVDLPHYGPAVLAKWAKLEGDSASFGEEPKATTHKFKVGDIVTHSLSGDPSERGEIVELLNFPGDALYRVRWNSKHGLEQNAEEYLSAAEPVLRYKTGEEVKIGDEIEDEKPDSFTTAELQEKLAGNTEVLQALGLLPEEKDVLTDVTVSAVKDADGDIWIQSFDLFGDAKFRFTVKDGDVASCYHEAEDVQPSTFAELSETAGPLTKVEL